MLRNGYRDYSLLPVDLPYRAGTPVLRFPEDTYAVLSAILPQLVRLWGESGPEQDREAGLVIAST